MKVSVVIPVYNGARTIERAVLSVLAQTVSPYEIIVVDDGSSDRSAEIVEAIDDSRVRYVHQTNAGASAARNRGLDLATGEWIAFLDADDWWEPQRIAAACEAIAMDPNIDFMQANRLYVDADGRRTHLKAMRRDLIDCRALLSGFTIKTSAVMIRRALIERHQLRFPTDQKTCEDYHLFWRALLFARAIGFTEAHDVMIHALPDSLSRGNSTAYLQRDNIKTLIEVRTWAREQRAKQAYVEALGAHLHWQLRGYLVTMMNQRAFGTVMRYAALALREEGPVRAIKSVLSALRSSLETAPPRVATR